MNMRHIDGFRARVFGRVGGYLSARTTYDSFSWPHSAIHLALVTFAVEKWISFLAKVHGQSVLRHGQSFARNSRFQRTLGGRARTGHGFHLGSFFWPILSHHELSLDQVCAQPPHAPRRRDRSQPARPVS
jgi:hypothetical protein